MAKIKYMGKYSGNPDDLPTQTYREGSVKFKEPETMKKLAIIANIGALIVAVFTLGLFYLRGGIGMFGNFGIPVGFLLVVVTMLPHEYLHAICFKEAVYVPPVYPVHDLAEPGGAGRPGRAGHPGGLRRLHERLQRGDPDAEGLADLPVQNQFLLVHAEGGLSDGGEKRTGAPGRRLLRR